MTDQPGTVTSRRSTRSERKRWPWGRYVATAMTADGKGRGWGANLTRSLAERQAIADAKANAKTYASTIRRRTW